MATSPSMKPDLATFSTDAHEHRSAEEAPLRHREKNGVFNHERRFPVQTVLSES
jgi:hypothetical protein